MTIYRSKVQLTPEELKVQAYLDGGKVQTQEIPTGTGPRNQVELMNPYKQGNKAQVTLF
jgi:hypothetical protein